MSDSFLTTLEALIAERKRAAPDSSYTASLFAKGIPAIAQKVGEEAVEVVIEAMKERDHTLLEESADLLFHLLVLLAAKGYGLEDVVRVLKIRHEGR